MDSSLLPGLDRIAPAARDLYSRDLASVAGIEKLRFFPLALESGSGCTLIEAGGRELLDLSATWTAAGLGHGHPKVVEALVKAARNPPGAGGLSAAHPDAVGLAEDLLELVPGRGDRRVYLGHAGSDACDVVIRAVRFATGKRRIVAFNHSYHGGIGFAMSASGVHVEAGTVGADQWNTFVDYPNDYRPPSGVSSGAQAALDASLTQVEAALAQGDVACVMAEPIQADGGMIVPPPGFLRGLEELCHRYNTLMVCDEVKVGLGRPGILHAFQLDGATPDLVCFGKVLGNGLPLSAAVGPAEILNGPSAAALLTTAGNPVCAAVGRSVLKVLQEEELPERARRAGERLRAGLAALRNTHVGDIRGHGLAIGVELVSDTVTKTPDPTLAAATVYQAFELGVVVFYVGGNVLEITPPLVISDAQVDRAVEIIGAAIDDAAAQKIPANVVAAYAGW
ncbi:MAG TPA: aminotransferase class III-fold pyridoxal phosphate-dependent enzyme [Acidimicrobiales bacterium]